MSLTLIRQLARRTGSSAIPCRVPRLVLQLNTPRFSPVSRTYASKSKVKSTSSFVPGSQLRFDSEETRAEYAKTESKMATVVDWFRKEVAGFETRASGRVTPALLSPVRVESRRGQTVKLEEVATVGIKDGSVLLVTVFDEQVRGVFSFLPFDSLACWLELCFRWMSCLLTDVYIVEHEGGRTRDICCQITQYCPSTLGFADVQDTHTQVGAVFVGVVLVRAC